MLCSFLTLAIADIRYSIDAPALCSVHVLAYILQSGHP